LRKRISALAKSFPPEEKYILLPQIKRASRSVTNNISEGYGRFSYTDTRHFFIQARGSVTETIDHLTVAYDEDYISERELLEHEQLCETVFKLINGYINYLDRKSKQQTSSGKTIKQRIE
jgi:four helix bundle protein